MVLIGMAWHGSCDLQGYHGSLLSVHMRNRAYNIISIGTVWIQGAMCLADPCITTDAHATSNFRHSIRSMDPQNLLRVPTRSTRLTLKSLSENFLHSS